MKIKSPEHLYGHLLREVQLIELAPLRDERGYFLRSFCRETFRDLGLHSDYPQENISFNQSIGTLRGMHMQTSPHEEIKVVTCLSGKIFDVVIDLRPRSETYRRWQGFYLSADTPCALYIPQGFAHGFLSLQDKTILHYMMSDIYSPANSIAYRWNDPAFQIKWPLDEIPGKKLVISEKDQNYPDFT